MGQEAPTQGLDYVMLPLGSTKPTFHLLLTLTTTMMRSSIMSHLSLADVKVVPPVSDGTTED